MGNVNFWVDSKNYNHIEMAHHIILVYLATILENKNLKLFF